MPEIEMGSTTNTWNIGIASSNPAAIGDNGAREVVRCSECHLVQFRTISDHCRKCARPLPRPKAILQPEVVPSEPEPAKTVVATVTMPNRVASERDAQLRGKTMGRYSLGPRLHELREARNLTQAEIAKAARVPRTYISRIERSHLMPGLGVIQRLANSLSVSLLELFPGHAASATPVSSNDSYWNTLVRNFNCLREDQKSAVLLRVCAMVGQCQIRNVA